MEIFPILNINDGTDASASYDKKLGIECSSFWMLQKTSEFLAYSERF